MGYALTFLRNTLPSRDPVGVIGRGGEMRYFAVIFGVFLMRFGLGGDRGRELWGDWAEMLLLGSLIVKRYRGLIFWDGRLDALQFRGVVWLFACKVSFLLTKQVHYLWHFYQVVLVIVTVFCMRLAKNVRRMPIYLSDGAELKSSDASIIYGYYRHHLLDERWHEGLIGSGDQQEMEEYLWYEGQLQKHISKCTTIECPCH